MAYIKTYDPNKWIEFIDEEGHTVYARKEFVTNLSFEKTFGTRRPCLIGTAAGMTYRVVDAKQVNKILRALKFNHVPKKYGHRMTEEYGRSQKSGRRK